MFATRTPARMLVGFALLGLLPQAFIKPAIAETPSKRADAILRKAMADRKIPGLQAAVLVNGKVVFSRSYGFANVQTPLSVNSKTVFSINSITKSFTGVAVMEEVEKGRLDLSAPISKYLQDIPQSWGKVTVRQLLGQISGLPDIFQYGEDTQTMGLSHEDKAWAWALTQPTSAPGETEEYNQTNLALIQKILNHINGRAPDASTIDAELAKAGMTETLFGDSRDVIKNKSQPYVFRQGVLHNQFEQFGPMLHAGSGLNTTASDMTRWMRSILNGTQMRAASREIMWTPVLLNNGKPSSFAIGWDVEYRQNYKSVGMTGGARSAFSLYPRYNVGVVILTNLLGANPEELTDEVAASFAPEIKLSGVTALRADAERSDFVHLEAMLAAIDQPHGTRNLDEEELESWASSLLFSGNAPRALILAKFANVTFPNSKRAVELLARAYVANAQVTDADQTYRRLLALDPTNSRARDYLVNK